MLAPLDVPNHSLREAEILKALPRAPIAGKHGAVTRAEIGLILGRCARQRRAVKAHHGFAFAHEVARGDVSEFFDEGVEAQSDDRLHVLVNLDHAGARIAIVKFRRATGSERTPVRCNLPGVILTVEPSSSSPS